ncbi:MAG: hypothetical protein LBT54_04720, partial [Bifidobacteriaceae bacterium]|nr:hypothetical protein [Bifidobacteriaceae bacterium]
DPEWAAERRRWEEHGLGAQWAPNQRGLAAFRRGFYSGFTDRIRVRLAQTRKEVEEEAAGSGKALVLASRQDRAREWAEDTMSITLETIRAARMSAQGWEAGTASGALADIGATGIGA